MGDLPGLVRLSIALRIQPNDGPVFFKVDGQRFGQNRTIKLLTGSSYKVEVKIKPTTLQAENISIGGVLVPLELKSKEPDEDRVVYTGTYDTEGVAPTKSGERQPIQITMPVHPFTRLGEGTGCATPVHRHWDLRDCVASQILQLPQARPLPVGKPLLCY
ncbi:CB1 cannabinoid receptor-interacting protein 1 isoform X5 [Nannospalax galili]|uniref:CB1 cannabinoid receptor-interacting protein 1 isoform X5 n=1 Tax=Nannospalax galili TaxID=1026970 RepID=UPI0004ED2F9B|nr:CB1 cannabinoid receptor-interacting protein 1 isoform X5 [Nannospalax galili]